MQLTFDLLQALQVQQVFHKEGVKQQELINSLNMHLSIGCYTFVDTGEHVKCISHDLLIWMRRQRVSDT